MSQRLRTLRILSITAAVLSFASVSTVTFAEPSDRVSNAQLSTLISAVRTETDANNQELAVRKIPILLNEADLGEVNGVTLQDLASLLNASNREVRRLVGFSLSMFEHRASFAVPRLTEILQSAECANLESPNAADADTASTMRLAIKNISGVNMPKAVCLLKLREPKGT
jgi:hypothetical protein